METKKCTFLPEKESDFTDTLRKRVNQYFTEKGISKYGNTNMVLKTIFMLLLYIGPWAVLLSGSIHYTFLFFLMWGLMGLGKAGIGMSISHDANHGTYAKKSRINKLLGYTMNLIGATPFIWKIQHNLLHHSYTNVHGYDDDIQYPSILRFSPHQKRSWFHRFQYIYVWFFYGISTLSWMSAKEFIQIFRFKKEGLIKNKKLFRTELLKIIGWKILYYTYIMVIPMLILPISPWMVVAGFLTMHFVSGMLMSLVFQTAHVMPSSTYPLPNAAHNINDNWALHQLANTSNYSPRSRIFSWLIGGLNYQVEHHLFTNICHVHYRKLSKIVVSTAIEYGIDYHSQKSFFHAIGNHVKMLYELGKKESKYLIKTPS